MGTSSPSGIRDQRADGDEDGRDAAGDYVGQRHDARHRRVSARERVGRRAVRGRALRLDLGHGRVELGELAVERDHKTPLVQTRQEHGPDVDFPRQQRRVRRDEQVHGDERRGRGERDENGCAVKVEHQQRASAGTRGRRREHAAATEHFVLRAEHVHGVARCVLARRTCPCSFIAC